MSGGGAYVSATWPPIDHAAELEYRRNAMARAVANAIGRHVPLSVRYRAADAALDVIAAWRNSDAPDGHTAPAP